MQMKHLAYAAILAVTSAAFVVGSGLPSQAAAKKKVAAAAPHQVFCTMDYTPVCAERGGLKQTYANSCFASHDNAKVISNGACGAKKAAKHHIKKMAMKKPMKKTKTSKKK